MLGGVGGDCKRGGEIGEIKYWFGGECSFQHQKGFVAGLVPGPRMRFLCKV